MSRSNTPTPRISRQNTSTHLMNDSTISPNTHLPLIPISPLVQQSLLHSHHLAIASGKLTQAKQARPTTPLPALRRLIEDVRIQRSKLDNVNAQIQSVIDVTLLFWDVDTIAKQITIINASLFSQVSLDQNLLTKGDRRTSKVQAVLDFHRYVANSFTHQLVIFAELQRTGSLSADYTHLNINNNNSINNTQISKSSQPPRDISIISHVVRLAYLLLHVYRDFSGFSAVMKALTSPEVRRIRRLWGSISTRTRELYKELSQVLSHNKEYKAYKDLLTTKLDSFSYGVGPGVTIAVPWIQPHWEEIKQVASAYAAGHHTGRNGGIDSSDIVLSTPGAIRLTAIVGTLRRCQQNLTPGDDDEREESTAGRGASAAAKAKSKAAAQKPVQIDGVRAIVPPVDVSALGVGDQALHHWLVSRVYLTKQQLIDESIEVEPLMHGEELPCNDFEEDVMDDKLAAEDVDDDDVRQVLEDLADELTENERIPFGTKGKGRITSEPVPLREVVDQYLEFLDRPFTSPPTFPSRRSSESDQGGGFGDELINVFDRYGLSTGKSDWSEEEAVGKATNEQVAKESSLPKQEPEQDFRTVPKPESKLYIKTETEQLSEAEATKPKEGESIIKTTDKDSRDIQPLPKEDSRINVNTSVREDEARAPNTVQVVSPRPTHARRISFHPPFEFENTSTPPLAEDVKLPTVEENAEANEESQQQKQQEELSKDTPSTSQETAANAKPSESKSEPEIEQELPKTDSLSVELPKVISKRSLSPAAPEFIPRGRRDLSPAAPEFVPRGRDLSPAAAPFYPKRGLSPAAREFVPVVASEQQRGRSLFPNPITRGRSLSPNVAVTYPNRSLSPAAVPFIPSHLRQNKNNAINGSAAPTTNVTTTTEEEDAEEVWTGYHGNDAASDTESERWTGYKPINEFNGKPSDEVFKYSPDRSIPSYLIPTPSRSTPPRLDGSESTPSEEWGGYPDPPTPTTNQSPLNQHDNTSETESEWKGYIGTATENEWKRESATKKNDNEWQGYTLGTYDQDYLDSSTLTNGQGPEFHRSNPIQSTAKPTHVAM